MDQPEPDQRSWFDPLRRIGDSLLGLAQTRFELFAVELHEEKLRALKLVIWVTVALAFGIAGLLVALGALALLLWDVAGYWGLIGLSSLSLGVAAFVLWRIRNAIQTEPAPFQETTAEFRKDFECLRTER